MFVASRFVVDGSDSNLDLSVPEKSLVELLRWDDRGEGEGENSRKAFSFGGVLELGFKHVVCNGGDASLPKKPIANNVEVNRDGFGCVEDDDASGDATLGGKSEERGARTLGREGLVDDDREASVKEGASGVKDFGGRLEGIEVGNSVLCLSAVALREEGFARSWHSAHEEKLLRRGRGKRKRRVGG